jgi:hypothetical protein
MPIMYGTIGLNATSNTPVGQNAPLAQGPAGEALVTELHGKFYPSSRAGNAYILATAAAGTTIPVQATNLVSTFTLWNPLGSGKNVELIRYSLAILAATTVVSDVSMYFQPGVGSTQAAPGTLTLLPIRSTLAGSTAIPPVSTGYSAATLVNVVGTNLFRGPTLASFGAVTDTVGAVLNYDFDGTFMLPPGTIVTVAGSAAQTSATVQSLTFAEWPV